MSSKAKTENKKLVLLDAHAIIHRAYHAMPDFSNSKGEPTGALYGISAMLISIIRDLNPDYCVACFDLPQPTYRHEVFKDYKKGRKKSDPELVEQIKRSRDVFAVFGMPIYEHAGFEADDVLGAIVEQVKDDKNLEVVIASGDMDTLQLVSGKKVQVYTLKKGIKDTIMYDEPAVLERFGFVPLLLPDYKGLRGDPSDNIPGIAGVGEKTATILIGNFGTLEDVYETLKKNPEKLEKAGLKPRILKLLADGKEEAYFSRMLATIRRDVPIEFELPKDVWRDEIDVQKVVDLFAKLEFRTLGERLKKLLGVDDPVRTDGSEDPTSNGASEKIDEEQFKETAVALWLLKSDITDPKIDDVYQFAGTEDFRKARENIFELLKERNLEKVYEDIEKPLIPVIAKMNNTGVKLDVQYLKKLSREYHTELDKLAKSIYKHAGQEFNIKSPKQLGEILFDKLELKPKNQKKTASGARSTKESELEKLRGEHPIIEDIFAYRELQKLLSTYIDNMPEMVSEDGRLRSEFVQTGTSTGRLSSRNPNLQNIPTKTAHGRRVRNAFGVENGNTLLALDYSQIELRVAAILSKDEKLVNVFKSGGDVHSAVAAEVFGVAPEDVDSEQRRRAKVINFGILYGMGVNALKKNLGGDTSTAEAREYLSAYFERFSGLAKWIDGTKADAARLGYTQTLFGRRRYFEGLNSKLPFIRAAAERMAVNAPVQGTAADILKIATVQVDKLLAKKYAKQATLVLQVHDELILEVKKGKEQEIAKDVKQIMEGVLSKDLAEGVPIIADSKVGDNWGALKTLL